ncbi:hypothetical protein SSX86_007086 [Deinandra increscens subsp. villosa]|uniref:HMA domain-containing protein n=1 Tax=Deinandra increscens subsp. villosa TaxID=3103831 RepID=A0AAP0H4E2_9ASTR
MCVNDQNEEKELEKQKKMLTTLATIESLTFPLVQEVVLLADFRCKACQDRVAHIISRLNDETESMEISFKEKKITLTLTRRHPKVSKTPKNNPRNAKIRKIRAKKSSLVKRIFCSFSS